MDRVSAIYCRAMLVPPRRGEGVVVINSVAVIVTRADYIENSEIGGQIFGVLKTHKAEVASMLLLGAESRRAHPRASREHL